MEVLGVVLEVGVAAALALGECQGQISGHWQPVVEEGQEVEVLHPEVCLLLVVSV